MEKENGLGAAPSSLIFVSLASMYLDNGMVDEAIDLCKSGLRIEPENEEAHLILAQAEIEKGKTDDGKKRLVELLQRNPENTAAKGLLDQIEEQVKAGEGEGEREEGREKREEGEEVEGEGEEVEGKREETEGKREETEGEITDEEKEIKKDEITDEEKQLENQLIGKIDDISKIEGIVNCFFRLKSGRIIKSSNLVGNIDELIPMLDSLLQAVESSSSELEMGKVTLILIEIEKGIFYIFSNELYDCFLICKDTKNFGLVKAILPKILG